MSVDTVFFLSDYGRIDEFVGVVHAVLRRLAPRVVVVDLTHDVPPFQVRAGAAVLARAFPYLGAGIVLAVVDPGVGGSRRAVVLETPEGTGPRWLVGPDNGLLLPVAVLAGGVERAVSLPRPSVTAGGPSTFDGRDLFAPAVAALAAGGDVHGLGVPVDPSTLVRVADPVLEVATLSGGRNVVRAEVTWIDRFGNVQLAAPSRSVPSRASLVSVAVVAVPGSAGSLTGCGPDGGRPSTPPETVRRVVAFSDLSPGEPGLLSDSNGRLALVLNEGSAAARYGVSAGALVEVVW